MQGHGEEGAHMQSEISRFVSSGTKQDFYRRLARTPAGKLPTGFGTAIISHEDHAGVFLEGGDIQDRPLAHQ